MKFLHGLLNLLVETAARLLPSPLSQLHDLLRFPLDGLSHFLELLGVFLVQGGDALLPLLLLTLDGKHQTVDQGTGNVHHMIDHVQTFVCQEKSDRKLKVK